MLTKLVNNTQFTRHTGITTNQSKHSKFLGVWLSSNMKFHYYVAESDRSVLNFMEERVRALRLLANYAPRHSSNNWHLDLFCQSSSTVYQSGLTYLPTFVTE